MRQTNLLVIILIAIFCWQSPQLMAGDDGMPFDQVLAAYKASVELENSIGMAIEVSGHRDTADSPARNIIKVQFYRDGNRLSWRGGMAGVDSKGAINPVSSVAINTVFDGDKSLAVSGPEAKFGPLFRARIAPHSSDVVRHAMYDSNFGQFLNGRASDNGGKSLVDLLSESVNKQVLTSEIVAGDKCMVIQGGTKNGIITAWVSMERGGIVRKWQVVKRGNNLMDNEPLSSMGVKSRTSIIDIDEVAQISGHFVAISGRYTERIERPNGDQTTLVTVAKRSHIEFSPDFEKVGAFRFDLPEGTNVVLEEFPGIKYEWSKGKPVPSIDMASIENIDKVIGQFPKRNIQQTNTQSAQPQDAAGTATRDRAQSRPWQVLCWAIGLLAVVVMALLVKRKLRRRPRS